MVVRVYARMTVCEEKDGSACVVECDREPRLTELKRYARNNNAKNKHSNIPKNTSTLMCTVLLLLFRDLHAILGFCTRVSSRELVNGLPRLPRRLKKTLL